MSSSKYLRVGGKNDKISKSTVGLDDIDGKLVDSKQNTRNWSIILISSANLVKNCVGSGVFSLNSRVSSISTEPSTLIPASFLVIFMAAWASYNFYMVGETCRMTETSTYAEAWRKSISPKSEWIVQFVTIVAPIISCLANVIVLTDVLSALLRYSGFPDYIWTNRNLVIMILTQFILLPISVLKDLSGLKSISVFGLFGHFVVLATLGIRILDKSYYYGGKYAPKVVYTLPSSHENSPSQFLVLASLLSYCLLTHYNAPRYFKEVGEKDSNPSSFPLFAAISYGSASIIYIITMTFGVALFGSSSKSFALNSLSVKDPFANIARLAFGASILASFPLLFLSVRTWAIQQLKQLFPSYTENKNIVQSTTMVLLSCLGLIATQLTDIGVVGSLSGGILGSTMMFVFPPIMYSFALIRTFKNNGKTLPLLKLFFNAASALLGTCLSVFGTLTTIKSLLSVNFK